MTRLIDADKLPEHKFTRESAKSSDYMRGWNDAIDTIVDTAPTVEPCYQTTSCLDCKMYDKENHHCPRFCEVIRELVKEAENE